MQTFLLVFHLLVAAIMIGVILIQRSEGGGLGFGGGTMGGAMTARGTANFLTRLTAILATVFFCTSLLLAILANQDSKHSIVLDTIEENAVKKETPPQNNSKEDQDQKK